MLVLSVIGLGVAIYLTYVHYSGTKPACTANDFSVGGQAVGSNWTDNSLAGDYVAGASKTGSVTVQMIDNDANQDNCQGVTVPLYMSAS